METILDNTTKIVLGSDPEFMFLDIDNDIYNASNIINSEAASAMGKDYDGGYIIGNSGKLGTDGVSTLGELRPRESDDILEHINNIKAIIDFIDFLAETHDLTAVAKPVVKSYGLGGHIHFNVFDGDTNITRTKLREFGVTPGTLARKCYDFVSPKLYFLFSQTDIEARRSTGYGAPNAIREQFHGGYEIRFFPTWLINPAVTLLSFSLTKIFLYYFYSGRPLRNFQNEYITCLDDCYTGIELYKLAKKNKTDHNYFDWNYHFPYNWQ